MPIKEKLGTVIKNAMNKTVTVAVKQQASHKKYKKIFMKTNKFYVHDENNECKIGDIVKIQETRPISKHKRWKLINKIIKK
uniref:Small ribosomal subunit protein uS17c n=1 Tax=Campylaephora sungminbooi TaxID=1896769 RepID=A0A1B0TI69_9FLOR|nr:30S ribosomal protein S17 [Campylaephora sungminbooi]AKU47415.1 30S ribosomal protein S17 [Campylaephora sungminbooi]ALN11862.1 30S ribosomal protein S17 [Campylaephora sungminbooi]